MFCNLLNFSHVFIDVKPTSRVFNVLTSDSITAIFLFFSLLSSISYSVSGSMSDLASSREKFVHSILISPFVACQVFWLSRLFSVLA